MSRLRVAVLGVGQRAEDHLRTLSRLSSLCELVGVGDADPKRARLAAEIYHAPAFTGLSAMLQETSPDLLYVIVPPEGHRAAVEIAADHGVHVVTETPIAPTLPLADAMIGAAARNQVKLEVSENVWRWPNERLKLKIVEAGLIGEVTQVHLWYRTGSYHGMSTARKLIGSAPIRARGFARETLVPGQAASAERPITGSYEQGLVEFASGAVCVYQNPLAHYRGNYWDVVGSQGAIVGSDLVLERDGERQIYPIRQVLGQLDGVPTLERVYVETAPPIVWDNHLRAYPVGAGADDVARADVFVGMGRAILKGGEPDYGAANARADQEVLIAIRESALRDGAWIDLPLTRITEVEQRLHAEFREHFGHDPLAPAEESIRAVYPQVSLRQMPRGSNLS